MVSWLPLNYEKLNLGTATYTPNTVYFNSRSYAYWCRSLFERAIMGRLIFYIMCLS